MNERYLYKAIRKNFQEFPQAEKWVFGVPMYIENKCMMLVEDEENLLRVHYTDDDMWGADIYAIEVDPSTICQCTGYKGIWENDIFQCDNGRYMIVFSDDSLTWNADSIFSSETLELGEFCYSEIDVIGNVFENPELMEVGE